VCTAFEPGKPCSDEPGQLVINGYYRRDGRCMPCPCDGIQLWQSLLLVALVIVVLLLLLEKVLRNVEHISTVVAPISIALTFGQTLGLLLDLEVPWPQELKDILSWFNMIFNFSIEIIHPECSQPFGVERKLDFALATPFIVAFITALFAGVQLLIAKHGDAIDHALFLARHQGKNPIEYVVEQIRVIVVTLFVFCSIFFLRSVLQVFNCSSPDYANGGSQYVRIQPDMECDLNDDEYFFMWLKAFVAIFMYSLVFAMLAKAVYHDRDLFGFLGDK
jgi:hypothetical protein